MKTWKRMLAALLLTIFLASSCAILNPLGPLTEEEEERIQEMFPYQGGD